MLLCICSFHICRFVLTAKCWKLADLDQRSNNNLGRAALDTIRLSLKLRKSIKFGINCHKELEALFIERAYVQVSALPTKDVYLKTCVKAPHVRMLEKWMENIQKQKINCSAKFFIHSFCTCLILINRFIYQMVVINILLYHE